MAMTNTTEFKAAETFLRSRLPRGGKLLCAVSGGLDSMCLLHFCAGLTGFTVTAAHFNHQLRGENAEADQRFVEQWCRERGIPCLTGSGDTRKRAAERGESIEEAARHLRYEFLEEAGASYDAILTAHHAADNAETVLLNLLRGTGSLRGIPAERGKILRPFLQIEKEALMAYAAENNIPHVEDETNQRDEAARNLLRHHVMPLLKELNPKATVNISRAAAIAAEDNALLEDLAASCAKESVQRAQALLEAPRAVASRAALLLLGDMAGGRKDLTARHAESLLDLARAGRGEAHFPRNVHARVDSQGHLIVWRQEKALEEQNIAPGQTLKWGDWEVLLTQEDNGGFGLCLPEGTDLRITHWRSGDRMTLPGSRGERSIKRLCADLGLSPRERDALPVLRTGEVPVAMARVGVNLKFAPKADQNTVYIKFLHKGEAYHEK